MNRIYTYIILLLMFLVETVYGTAETNYPIIFQNDTIGYFYKGIANLDANERAEFTNRKLDLLKDSIISKRNLKIVSDSDYSHIYFDDIAIISLDKSDASLINLDKEQQIKSIFDNLQKSISHNKSFFSDENLLEKSLFTLALLLVTFLFIFIILKYYPRIYIFLTNRENRYFRAIIIRDFEIISAKSELTVILSILQLLRLFLLFLVIKNSLKILFDIWDLDSSGNVLRIIDGLISAVFLTIIVHLILKMFVSIFEAFIIRLSKWRGSLIKSIQFQSLELLSEERMADAILLTAKILRVATIIFITYIYLTILFSLFYFTEDWSSTLVDYIITPITNVSMSVINYLPNLFNIAIISIAIYYLSKFVKFIFLEIQKGNIKISGFHEEWALPTFKIVRFLLFAFGAIVIFPYLPGSNSPFFQGITIFLGVLFSLGSSTAVSNMVAGSVITYMRPFKIGDRIKIADATGDVIEKTLLVTRIRTIKNVDITIPNSMVLSSHIINYSANAQTTGLILNTTITIGYDVPWKTVHELLLNSAKLTPDILESPEPFVLQTSLDDYYVSYQLNAYTKNANSTARIYSNLHSNIQDEFNRRGVEILSPAYSAIRDGNKITIPEDYLPKDYKAPGFNIPGFDKFFK